MRDTIDMAREAGVIATKVDGIERFEALVRADEREACVEDIKWHVPRVGRHMTEYQMAEKMIVRIRARGEASKRGETK